MFNNQVRQRMKGLVAGIGPSIITNPDLLESKLADLATDNAEDVRLIVSAAKAGIPEEIAAAPPEQRAELAQQAATWMASETGVSPEAAQWAVESWSTALEGVKIAPTPDAVPASQPATLSPPPIAPSGTAYGAGAPPAPWDTPRAPQPQSPWGAPPGAGPGQGYGAPPPGSFPPPPGAPGYPPPGMGYGQPKYYTQTVNASQILTLGILSFFCLGIILGPIAWLQGNNALGQIDDGYADPSQRGTVLAGRTCGMIATILHGCWLILYIIFFIIGLTTRMHSSYP